MAPLLPELYPAIIASVWNSSIDYDTRARLAGSSLQVSKQWNFAFKRVTREITAGFYHGEERDEYLCVDQKRNPTEERLEEYKLISVIYYEWTGRAAPLTMGHIFSRPNGQVNWPVVLRKERFPNLNILSVDRHKDDLPGFVGLESDWSWLTYGVPEQVQTMEFINTPPRHTSKNDTTVSRPFLVNPEDIIVKCRTVKHLHFLGMENDSIAWAFLAPLFPNIETVEADTVIVEKPLCIDNRMSKDDYYQWFDGRADVSKRMKDVNDLSETNVLDDLLAKVISSRNFGNQHSEFTRMAVEILFPRKSGKRGKPCLRSSMRLLKRRLTSLSTGKQEKMKTPWR